MELEALRELLREELQGAGLGEAVPLGRRWQGGTLVLRPADPALQAKEIPIDSFFRKVVSLRDRLRVIEQKVNAQAELGDVVKLEVQQAITRAYGSLTSFNVLFADSGDHFVGSGGAQG